MSDIVERLRKRRETETIDGWERVEFEDTDALEAADEIERLRAALEKINVGEGWAAQIARAALEASNG
jgi:hypothetical protein